jgi:glycosyltransferase involved in cell wall biosynthesis
VSVERSPGGHLRVLHLYAGNLYGGIETLLVTLARFRDLGGPMVPEFGLCFRGRLWDELKATGATVHDLGEVRFSRPWTVWRSRRRLRALLTREQFDVVVCHACWPHALFAPVVRRCGGALVFWAHDIANGTHWIEERARRTSPDLVVANSRYTASTLLHLFPAAPTEVLHSPVPSPAVIDRAAARRAVRQELDALDDVVILQSCRLEPWKGHSLLINALQRLRSEPGWVCWLTGNAQRPHEADYLRQLQAQALDMRICDRLRFLGHRRDLPSVLAAADIHCQPNIGPEPLGVAFIEAMYAGLPVVTTAQGGALETVDDTCGILVPPGDAVRLADALQRLVDSPAERMRLGQAGPRRAAAVADPVTGLSRLHDILHGAARSAFQGCAT